MLNVLFYVLVVFNFAAASAYSYKESMNTTNKKNINGYILAVFSLGYFVGSLVYKLISHIASGMTKVKSIVTGIVDFVVTFAICYVPYKLMAGHNLSYESYDFVDKLLHVGIVLGHVFLCTVYYGFVVGIFGGDNCRIQPTILSMPFIAIHKLADKIGGKDIGIDFDFVKNEVTTDISEMKTEGKIHKIDVVGYFKGAIACVLNTVAEWGQNVTSLYVGIKNILGFIGALITLALLYGIIWIGNGGLVGKVQDAENMFDEIAIDPVSIITDSLKSFLVTILVVTIIKIIISLLFCLLPQRVQSVIFGASNKLSEKILSKCSNDGATNINNDEYAHKYANKLMEAAYKGRGRRL